MIRGLWLLLFGSMAACGRNNEPFPAELPSTLVANGVAFHASMESDIRMLSARVDVTNQTTEDVLLSLGTCSRLLAFDQHPTVDATPVWSEESDCDVTFTDLPLAPRATAFFARQVARRAPAEFLPPAEGYHFAIEFETIEMGRRILYAGVDSVRVPDAKLIAAYGFLWVDGGCGATTGSGSG